MHPHLQQCEEGHASQQGEIGLQRQSLRHLAKEHAWDEQVERQLHSRPRHVEERGEGQHVPGKGSRGKILL